MLKFSGGSLRTGGGEYDGMNDVEVDHVLHTSVGLQQYSCYSTVPFLINIPGPLRTVPSSN
jgi:hypothetical protein